SHGLGHESIVLHHGAQRFANAALVINNENRISHLVRGPWSVAGGLVLGLRSWVLGLGSWDFDLGSLHVWFHTFGFDLRFGHGSLVLDFGLCPLFRESYVFRVLVVGYLVFGFLSFD